MSGADELRALRASCFSMIAAIDSLLVSCPPAGASGQECFPMVVPGRCRTVKQHAIDRWRERTGSKKGDTAIIHKLEVGVAAGEEWELKAKYMLVEILAHGQHARYFKHGGMFFVVEEGTLVTVHDGAADRWRKKAPRDLQDPDKSSPPRDAQASEPEARATNE